MDGGLASHMVAPARALVGLRDLDPSEAAPLIFGHETHSFLHGFCLRPRHALPSRRAAYAVSPMFPV